MHYFALSVLLVAVVNAASAQQLKLDGLRITYSTNPNSEWGLQRMPRDLASAGSEWVWRDNQCGHSGASFLGQRYWYKREPAVTLVYDKNGIIAGIQTSIPKSEFTPAKDVRDRYYIDDGNYWTVAAYFVDPRTICTTGRTLSQLQTQGTATGFWQQAGPDPVVNSVYIPMNEEDMRETTWTFGKCFPTMGNHYWHNVTKEMSCDKFVPNCILYNKGQLTAFCFAINAILTSPRYEPVPIEAAGYFMDPVPNCFHTDPSFKRISAMHVYLVDDPLGTSWC